MVLRLSPATESEAEDIASVHLAAFSSNILLHAQFPTPASLLALREFLRQDTLRDLRDPGKAVLVVRDTRASNLIVGFAKWDLPGHDASHSDITWPEGCREEYLKGYYEKVMAARDRVMGGRHCYCKMTKLSSSIWQMELVSHFYYPGAYPLYSICSLGLLSCVFKCTLFPDI
jgi:hypothetical protein